jgi:xanthine/uracil permease
MTFPPLSELVPVLQIAIGPVILISGVGLLLLSITNRLGRAIDRARLLRAVWSQADTPAQERIVAQLHVLWRRADILRKSIILASLSLLLAACLIIVLFAATLMRWDAGAVIIGLFVGCLAALVGSLTLLIWDVNQSLSALRLELQDAFEQKV